MGSLEKLFKAASLACLLIPVTAYTLRAAPQILAVASTTIDINMPCFDGTCSAELSAICLQEDRSAPYAMTDYYIHGGKTLVLTGHKNDGQEIKLSNLPLRIVAARGQNAVRVSFPEKVLKLRALLRISVTVPGNITMIPTTVAGDDNPQTAREIAQAAGVWRHLATGVVDKDTQNKTTAELVNHAINGLPLRGRADPVIRDQAKAQFIEVTRASGFSRDAKDRAVRIVSRCHNDTVVGLQNYRQCLGSWHDMLLKELNADFWDAAKTGS